VIAYLDTQVVIFVADGEHKRISRDARHLINRAELLISPMVLIELGILHEIRRIELSGRDIQRKLEQEIGLRVCTLPFQEVAEVARDEGWTRDPFDRIIVAQAKANHLSSLISADQDIARHYQRTVW